MPYKTLSIRPFIGAEHFETCRSFYKDMGFEEVTIAHNMSYFKLKEIGFYLQDAYVKDWVDNTMVFVEVDDVEAYWSTLLALNLPARYNKVRIEPIRSLQWGKECFVHDPSGVLWHFGEFSKQG